MTLELEERHGTILSKSVHVAVFGILERKAIPPTDSKINLYIAQYQVLNQVTSKEDMHHPESLEKQHPDAVK